MSFISNENSERPTKRMTVLAPAKLNLALAVGDIRPDGYHEVMTIMQTIDLVDRIDIDVEFWDQDSSDILVEAPNIPGGDTLVTRAVSLLLEELNQTARVWITIEKNIPIGAGLGGGSSDAGTVLRAINSLALPPLKDEKLLEVASSIGSDVPFFTLGSKVTALVTGRGENVQSIKAIAPRSWLIVFPNANQSTSEVYAAFRPELSEPFPSSPADLLTLINTGIYRNDLALAAQEKCAKLSLLCDRLHEAGAEPLVCGSGSAVAVLFNGDEQRKALQAVALQACADCWTCVTKTTG